LGYILGDFFANSSGHPDPHPNSDAMDQNYLLMSAIRDRDPDQVQSLLEQGADPDAW
jgi:hypothetical protein